MFFTYCSWLAGSSFWSRYSIWNIYHTHSVDLEFVPFPEKRCISLSLGILAHLVRWWLWWSHHLLNKVFRFREGDWFPIGYWTWWKWEIFPASHLAIVVENQPSSNLPRKEKCRPRATAWCNEATDFDPSWKGEPVYSSRGVCTGGWGGSSKWRPWIERSGFLGVYFFCLWKQLEHKELGFCWERWV